MRSLLRKVARRAAPVVFKVGSRQLLRGDPTKLPGLLQPGAERLLREAGRLSYSRKDFGPALQHLEKAASVGTHHWTWLWLARTQQALGDNAAALASAERAVQILPDFPDGRGYLASLHEIAGRSAEAQVQYTLLAEGNYRLDAAPKAFDILAGKGRLEEAATLLSRLEGRTDIPADWLAESKSRLDLLRAWRENPAGIEPLLDRARAEHPESPALIFKFWLSVGRVDKAAEEQARVPDRHLDAGTLHQLAWKARHAGHLTAAATVARRAAAVRHRPSLRSSNLAEICDREVQMIREGFRLPERRGEPLYDSAERSAFYLLHNSLPHNSAGYATRTHGLLTGLHAHGWQMRGVTRLGYPYDRWASTDERVVPLEDVIDDIPYSRLLTEARSYSRTDLDAYITQYVDLMRPLAMEHRPAIIHGASNFWNGLAAASAAREWGVKSVYEVRGLWEVTRGSREPEWVGTERHQLMEKLEAEACLAADKVLAITGALKDEMVRRGVPEESIVLVHNGVDAGRFDPRERDTALAAKLGVQDKKVIGYVGSILDYEGIELLLEATARLKAERSDFAVLIVGDGDVYENCLRVRDQLGIGDVVTFTGRVPHAEVEAYYSLVDIAPFPRLPLPVCEMVSPLKPFEAMAMKKVPVVSSCAALVEIVQDGVTGRVFEKGDVDSFVAVLRDLLDDEAQLTKLGEAAREWVVRERDWSVLTKRVDVVYSELLER